jgi:hypothetical protein
MFAKDKRKQMRRSSNFNEFAQDRQSRYQPQANRRFNKYNNKHDDEMVNESDSDDEERAASEQAKSSYYQRTQARRFK